MIILELKEISKRFGGLLALDRVSFKVNEGEVLGLIGPNGAGKTTAFNIITGFLPVTQGDIYFAGRKVTHLRPHSLARMGMVRTWQGNELFKDETCLTNMLIAHHLWIKIGFWGILFGTSGVGHSNIELRKSAIELLDSFGLGGLKDELAGNLPHGHQRGLLLCMALAAKPRLLLLDEPFAGLNHEEILQMIGLIKRVNEQGRVTIVLVDHNMKIIMSITDRIIVLNHGRKISEGRPEEVCENEEVSQAYLGHGFGRK